MIYLIFTFLSFQYRDVRNLVPTEAPSVFLDVGIAGLFSGTVHIRMLGDTTRAHQMLLLCSGEQGPSYKRSRFYGVAKSNNLAEILRGGDYEANDGTAGRNIITGIQSGGVYRAEIATGLVAGWPDEEKCRLGSFNIYLRQCPGAYDDHSFGIVTSGLDVLRSVAKHHPVTDSLVIDCGIAIYL